MTDSLIPPSHRGLLAPPAPVTLAMLGPTGYPQVTAIWVVLEGGLIEVRGDVTIEPDPGLETLRRVLAAYGTDLESFGGPLDGRVTVALRPARVVAQG